MKILIDASITSIGGGVQVALSLIENIANDNDFEVICVTNPEIDRQLTESIKSKFKHYYVENIVPMHLKFIQGKRLAKIEKDHNPDFVFIVFGPAYWKPKAKTLQGFALGKMLYQRELNTGFSEKILNLIKAQIFKWSDSALVVETELVKRKLAEYLNYDEQKIFVVGNSYSPNFKANVVQNENILFPDSNFFQILIPGSYYPHKNLERIVSAIKVLKSRLMKDANHLRFIFTIPTQSAGWQNLQRLAQEFDVENLIDTVGFIENARFAELYLKSNAIICASLVESSTAVFPEAFIAGRPLLVSDRPFAREMCEDAALYFDPLDEESIANAIEKLLLNESIQRSLVESGKNVLLKNYPSADKKWALQKELLLKLNGK